MSPFLLHANILCDFDDIFRDFLASRLNLDLTDGVVPSASTGCRRNHLFSSSILLQSFLSSGNAIREMTDSLVPDRAIAHESQTIDSWRARGLSLPDERYPVLSGGLGSHCLQ